VIDVTQPLEFEDGTPVEYVKIEGDAFAVRIASGASHRRCGTPLRGTTTFYYNLSDGTFVGGGARHLVIRNVDVAADSEMDEVFR
jgi:hypothetical protein